MGATPSTAIPAKDVLAEESKGGAASDKSTALLVHGENGRLPLRDGRIARFAKGKAKVFSNEFQPKAWLLYHSFVVMEVVWERKEAEETAPKGQVAATSDDKEGGDAPVAQVAAPARRGVVVERREIWRLDFNWKSKVWVSRLELTEEQEAALQWKVPPCERRMSCLPVRNGWYDGRYNNCHHFTGRVMNYLGGTKRDMRAHWAAFWKWFSDRGGDLPLHDADNDANKTGDDQAKRDEDDKSAPVALQVHDDTPPAAVVATPVAGIKAIDVAFRTVDHRTADPPVAAAVAAPAPATVPASAPPAVAVPLDFMALPTAPTRPIVAEAEPRRFAAVATPGW